MLNTNCTYRIKGEQEYFRKKYGTFNPIIKIEGTDKEYFGTSWLQHHLLLSMDFIDRLISMNRLSDGLHNPVYYGRIQNDENDSGEFILEDEVEEIKTNKQ